MKLQEAVKQYILESSQGAWSTDDLKILVNCLHEAKEWKGVALNIRTETPYSGYENIIIKRLARSVLVKKSNSVYIPFGRPVTDREILNAEHPYAYFGFLTAMDHYGLTDKIPNKDQMVVPSDRAEREEISRKFFSQKYSHFKSSRLDRILANIVNAKSDAHIRTQLGHSQILTSNYEERALKRTTLPRYVSKGRLFVDMLDSPDLCGGIDHVLDVFSEYAEENKAKILSILESQSISNLTKVRLGFVLSELCGIKSPDVLSLKNYKRRGSSSKLYAPEPFSSKYIALDWDLSLNIERPEFDRFRYTKLGKK